MSGGLRKRTAHFVQVGRPTVRDGRLSFRALGGLTYLLDRPEGWDVRAEQMSGSGEGREGREAVRTLLRELAAAGYYRLERRRMLDGRFAMGTAVSEEPVESWAVQHRFFAGRAVPMVQQRDGAFLVMYPDGTLAPDDFPPPDHGEPAGAQKPVSGGGTDPPGPRNPESGEPESGEASPLEDAKREMREGIYNPPSAPSGADVTAVPARGRTGAASPRGKKSPPSPRRPPPRPRALGLLAQLPRPWRDCEPWVRRRLAARLDVALDTYGAGAVAAAVRRYAPEPGEVGDGRVDPDTVRHLAALDRVLALLGVDVMAGACTECGDEHTGRACDQPDTASGRGWLALVPGVCVVCDGPDATARMDLPLGSCVCDDCWTMVAVPDTAAA